MASTISAGSGGVTVTMTGGGSASALRYRNEAATSATTATAQAAIATAQAAIATAQAATASTRINLSAYADNTGVADISAGLLAAVAAATPIVAFATPLKVVYIDPGTYSLQTECDLTGENVRLIGGGGTILVQRGDGDEVAEARLYGIRSMSGIFEADGVWFDGGDDQPTSGTAGGKNTYVIRVGPGESATPPEVGDTARSEWMERVSIHNCRFTNLLSVGDDDVETNLKVMYAIYAWGVKTLKVNNNHFESISGAALFARQIASLWADDNTIWDTQWYGLNFSYDCSGQANGNDFDCRLTTGIFKGGFINTVNDMGMVQNINMVFRRNRFAGYVAYGAALRCQSDLGVTIADNWFGCLELGSLAGGDSVQGISVITRNATDPGANPPRDVTIDNNKFLLGFGSGNGRVPIYVHNDYFDGSVRKPMYGVKITNNRCSSPTTTEYMTNFILVSGSHGGIEDVRIFDNVGTCYLKPDSTGGGTTAPFIIGGIGIRGGSTSNDDVIGVQLGGNHVDNLQTPVNSVQSCLYIGRGVSNVRNVRPNNFGGGYIGVNVDNEGATTGPVLEDLDDQIFDDCTTDTVFSTRLSRYAKPLNVTSGTRVDNTGSTSKTALATVVVPGGQMGPKGILSYEIITERSGSGGAATLSVEFGGLEVFTLAVATGNVGGNHERQIINCNDEAVQLLTAKQYTAYAISTSLPVDGAVDTSVDQNLIIYSTLSNAGDTQSLRGYRAKIEQAA